MGELSVANTPLTATDRERITGGSTQIKKRNQRDRMNSTFMRMRTVDMTDLNVDTQSMDQPTNQNTAMNTATATKRGGMGV